MDHLIRLTYPDQCNGLLLFYLVTPRGGLGCLGHTLLKAPCLTSSEHDGLFPSGTSLAISDCAKSDNCTSSNNYIYAFSPKTRCVCDYHLSTNGQPPWVESVCLHHPRGYFCHVNSLYNVCLPLLSMSLRLQNRVPLPLRPWSDAEFIPVRATTLASVSWSYSESTIMSGHDFKYLVNLLDFTTHPNPEFIRILSLDYFIEVQWGKLQEELLIFSFWHMTGTSTASCSFVCWP